jgi:Protein of unknown function (DUF1214)
MSETRSTRAFHDLLEVLADVELRFLGPEYAVTEAGDNADGHRLLMHILETAVHQELESDPDRPEFRLVTGPHRKALGDNPDAIYLRAPLDPEQAYRVSGNLAGAVYLSFTIEAGAPAPGRYPTRSGGVINNTQFDVDADGSYEVFVGGPPRGHNWIELPGDAGKVTVRMYFEEPEPVAAHPERAQISIETLDPMPPAPTWDDESIAAGIERVANYVLSRTLDQPPSGAGKPSWVAPAPNVFPEPQRPGNLAVAAFDAAYCSAPYALGPDEALVITGRWPVCCFANVVLWNRYLQSYDYVHRPVWRNRSNTVLEPDGSFRMVLAHRDPGVANWLDTEGRPHGQLFWRFMLPEGDIETPHATVVLFDEVCAGTPPPGILSAGSLSAGGPR